MTYSQEHVQLLTAWSLAVEDRQVLGVLEHPTVQEEDPLRRLFLLLTVQCQLHLKSCCLCSERKAHRGLTTSVHSLEGRLLYETEEKKKRSDVLREGGAPWPFAFIQYFTLKLEKS